VNSIRHITVGPHGCAAIEVEPDGGYVVTAWTASGKLAVTDTFPAGCARQAANLFGRLTQAVRP
jgi:hypothetical protein